MRTKTLINILKWTLEPNKMMANKYPKAAKRRRIIKKWKNRFGPDPDWKDMFFEPNPYLSLLSKEGTTRSVYPIPIIAEGMDEP